MTCIVGYIEKDVVYIGGDSAGVAGLNVIARADTKVFAVKNFIMGYTSSFRMGQILRFSFDPPEHPEKMDTYEYMCTLFIDELRSCLKEKGFSNINNNEESGGTFLVGYKKRLFEISDDFQVGENIDCYDSCGCGKYYALGSMYATSETNPVTILNQALTCASKFSGGVLPPYNVYALKDDKVEIVLNKILE